LENCTFPRVRVGVVGRTYCAPIEIHQSLDDGRLVEQYYYDLHNSTLRRETLRLYYMQNGEQHFITTLYTYTIILMRRSTHCALRLLQP